MCVEIFGPCLLVEDVPASAGFYFVRADHDTVPEGYRGRRTQGLIIGLLVPDAAA